MTYNKDYLISAVMWKYETVSPSEDYRRMLSDFYDVYGKDKFRSACGLDAEMLRKFRSGKAYLEL